MQNFFSIQKDENQIVLYNLNNIDGLIKGDIFFRKNEDETTDILPEFEYLDKQYLNSIVDKLSEEEEYDFYKLENKLI
jgi:hypothetical protein